ncbi:hypothetical protein KY347_05960 [Candidatus Woesearchaeota archaeon]|nr:hypothetical protein [Candidatus Woesearchaeota archaeon]
MIGKMREELWKAYVATFGTVQHGIIDEAKVIEAVKRHVHDGKFKLSLRPDQEKLGRARDLVDRLVLYFEEDGIEEYIFQKHGLIHCLTPKEDIDEAEKGVVVIYDTKPFSEIKLQQSRKDKRQPTRAWAKYLMKRGYVDLIISFGKQECPTTRKGYLSHPQYKGVNLEVSSLEGVLFSITKSGKEKDVCQPYNFGIIPLYYSPTK